MDEKVDAIFALLIEVANMNKATLEALNKLLIEVANLNIAKKEEPKPEEPKQEDKLMLIRKMAQNIIMDGRDADIKKLFADHGIKKLSELEAGKYDDFIRILGGM